MAHRRLEGVHSEFEGVEPCAFRRRTGAGAVAGEERGACGDRPGSGTIVVGVLMRVERARVGVETGGCPHTAIREDASINLEAVDRLLEQFPDADIVFIESGGDNLAATFSPELVDSHIYVISVAQGGDIPRKGSPGIEKSPLLIINKTDLLTYVNFELEQARREPLSLTTKLLTFQVSCQTGDGLQSCRRWLDGQLTAFYGRSSCAGVTASSESCRESSSAFSFIVWPCNVALPGGSRTVVTGS